MKIFMIYLIYLLLPFYCLAEFDKNNYTESDWTTLKNDIKLKLYEALTNYLSEQQAPGGCIGIQFIDAIQVCSGLSDISAQTSMTSDMYYRIASTTKTFTAVSILQLIEQGKLGLNDTIGQFFPDIDYPNKQIITIYHLLHMSSGIFNYLTDEYYSVEAMQQKYTPEQLIQIGISKGVQFEPGNGYSYSNTNYVMLGVIIEQVSGQTYANYIKDTLLKNLGLNKTYEPLSNQLPTPYAKGYMKTENSDVEIDLLDPSLAFATGSMISTVEEMTQWMHMLMQPGKVLGEQGLKNLLDFSVEMDAGYYGGGLEKYTEDKLGPLPSQNIVGKVANIMGYTSIMTYDMDEEMSIVVFINYENQMAAFLSANMALNSMAIIKEAMATFESGTIIDGEKGNRPLSGKYVMQFIIFIGIIFMLLALMKA